MAGTVIRTTLGTILDYALNRDTPLALTIRLYTNDYTPTTTSTVGNFTEAAGFGYTEVLLGESTGDWTIDTSTNIASATHTEITWTFTGALGNVYGYYIIQEDSPEPLLGAERFSNGPYNIQNDGDEIKVTPKLTLRNL